MTSCFATNNYKDLIQGYDLADLKRYPPKNPSYDPNSVMGFLHSNGNFKIFSYLLKIANTDIIANQKEFMSTMFVSDDETLKKQLGEEFFMNLDRNSAIKLVNLQKMLVSTGIILDNIDSEIEPRPKGKSWSILSKIRQLYG